MDLEESAAAVAKILDRLGIVYAVTGGYALAFTGRLRTTFDIDIILELPASRVDALASALQKISEAAYVDKNMILRAVERHGEFNVINPDSGVKIDFWVQGASPYIKEKLKRREMRYINGYKVSFVSPEDLILSKLLWHKVSESEQQFKDVESLVLMQKNLDWPYLWKWSKKQGTARILRELKAQASKQDKRVK